MTPTQICPRCNGNSKRNGRYAEIRNEDCPKCDGKGVLPVTLDPASAAVWEAGVRAMSTISTHGPECWTWGGRHYECALIRIKELETP